MDYGTDRTRTTLARWALACALPGILAVLAPGCVTVYQPLSSLQRPVAVDPRLPNFEGLHLLVRCVPGDDLSTSDAQFLCRKVGTLFRNQGATVNTEIPRAGHTGLLADKDHKPDLVLDLKWRRVHEESNSALTVLSGLTFTLVPAVEEQSDAQEVTVRDGSGSLLASDTYQSRFISYYGVGVWGVNKALDVLVRPKEEALTGDGALYEFSHDFYGQLSQLVLNARVRQQVLGNFQPAAVAAPSPAAD